MAGSSADRTEAPTPKRRREARRKGQIPKSVELVAWTQVLAATFVLEHTGAATADAIGRLLVGVRSTFATPDPSAAVALLGDALWAAAVAAVPLAAVMAVVGVVGHVVQTGGSVALQRLAPKAERLNPLKGAKRLLSPQGLWNGTKSVVKVGVLVVVAGPPLRGLTNELIASGRLALPQVAASVATTAVSTARMVAVAGLALAAVDYGVQRRQVTKRMRMTKQEVKDEHRQSGGDPQLKGHIRQKQLAISRNRMITSVGDASVVIVNPTHVAVALRYEPVEGAPRVLAKGKGDVARRIRDEAERHFVPIVRDVPLARTLESTCRLGQEIPADLYEAVARVLAFLTTLGSRRALGGTHTVPGRASGAVTAS